LLFPVAGVEIHPALPVAIGLGLGVLSGLFGVGGGFLATPILIWIGVPPIHAVGSGLNQMVGASSSGATLNARLGNVWYRAAGLVAAGGLPAGIAAAFLVRRLEAEGAFDRTLGVMYVLLLVAVGVRMVLELRKRRGSEGARQEERPVWGWRRDLGCVGIGVGAGVLSAFLGVGGGVVLVPLMIYVLGIPTRLAIGTSLFQVMIIAFGMTVVHAGVNASVDVVLAMLIMSGAIPGTWVGVWLCRKLKTESLRGLFGALVLVAAAKMAWDVAAGAVGRGACEVATSAELGPVFSGIRRWATSECPGARLLYGLCCAAVALLLGGALGTLVRKRVCEAGQAESDRPDKKAAD